MRSRTSWLLILPTLLVGSLISAPGWNLNQVLQDPAKEPTVFRNVPLGTTFPDIELLNLEGKGLVFEPSSEKPTLVAFLRPDQEASLKLLAYLEKLALDSDSPDCQLSIVGMSGRRGPSWEDLGKALPRKIQLYLDAGTVSRTLGIIVLPSVAVLDSKGKLFRAHVLFDDDSPARILADLQVLANGEAAPLDEAEQARRRFAYLGLSADALEAVDELEGALELRMQQAELGVETPLALLNVGRTNFRLGRFANAVDNLRASIKLESTINAQVWLGRALARQGKLLEAETVLQGALPLSPRKAIVHRELADIFKQRGDLDQALVHMRAALAALNPVMENVESSHD